MTILGRGILLVVCLTGADPQPKHAEKVRQLMQDRNYAEAVKAIDEAVAAKSGSLDELALLKGRALFLQKEYLPAAEVFANLEKTFPQSPLVRQARFSQALARMRVGDFRAAELLYKGEVLDLLSADRKHEIASIYLEFADKLFKPAKETDQPDFIKALEFYRKALEVGPNPVRRIEVELRVAECLQNLDKFSEAAPLYEKFAKDHAGHALAIEARYRLGDCQLHLQQLASARKTWQDLLADHTNVQSPRIVEAAFNLAKTYGMPKPSDDEDLDLGVAALRSFVTKYPNEKLASTAYIWIAQAYLERNRLAEAVTILTDYLAQAKYADRDETPAARSLLGQAYQRQGKFTEAIAAWRDYLAKHPAHQDWSSVQEQIVNTEYLMAVEQQRVKKYDDARKLWTEFLNRYPLDGRAPEIMLQFGLMQFAQEKWDAAIADWRRLVSKYPNTNPASHGQFLIATTLEEKQDKLADALAEYKKVTWGSHQPEAQKRIARLTAKSMLVATERIYRSDEAPAIKLTSRNIDAVTVRVYSVDLETYFRKMHRSTGVEELDIALIDPDKTFEFKVPDYAEYKETSLPLPLRLDKTQSGAWAVTVSSKTLEASTLVLQSDLDVIVKTSREEVFVFAENMRTGKPWANARILVSNGNQVLAEAATGPDGVLQKAIAELKEAGDIRVFAIAGGNIASNLVSLQGVGIAQGLAAKGYIYTDRPAYRAGQIVNVRGILREVAGDLYTVPAGKGYVLDVFDPRNRQIHSKEVTLSNFGSFQGHLILPDASPQGEYRVQLREKAGQQSFQGTFLVHEYKLEPVRLAVDTERKVYYRGEEIKGTIRASFYYGTPLAGAEIRYQFADQPAVTAKTNEKGEVAFTIATRDFRETQTLPLVAVLPERNLQIGVPFFLATRGYSIAIETVRPVFLADESFEATVKTIDAEGKPIGVDLVVNVVERTVIDGRAGEKQIESHKLTTDKADGTGRITLTLKEGAEYVLRGEGIDRFKNPVTGQHVVTISDDNDPTRLRLLANRHTFKVGDTAGIEVHWREEPALALVAYQGARVLGYRLIELKTGNNKLDIPMTVALAPNFDLSVAVMTDVRKPADPKKPAVRFHEATSPFTVVRSLNVALTTQRKNNAVGAVKPGEEIDVTVRATDPQGKPVAAEVSLAMVEAALLDRFPSALEAIDSFYRGNPRESAVRTASSITFDYRPKTSPINPLLLAEADRLALAEQEEKRLAVLALQVERLGENLAAARPEEAKVQVEDEVAGAPATPQSAGGVGGMGAGGAGFSRQSGAMMGRATFGAAAGDEIRLGARMRASRGLQRESRRAELARQLKDSPNSGFEAFSDSEWGDMTFRGNETVLGYDMDFGVPHGVKLSDAAAGRQVIDAYVRNGQTEVWAMMTDGNLRSINLGQGVSGAVEFDALARQLHEQGAVVLPSFRIHETGYWNPSIATDESGTAKLRVTVPQRSTAWKLTAKGITEQTLAGEAASDLVAKKDLFGELKLPLAFLAGDKTKASVVVHNDAIENGEIKVTLRTTIAVRGSQQDQKKLVNEHPLKVTSKGMQELTFDLTLDRPEGSAGAQADVQFELVVTVGELSDTLRTSVPLLPGGIPVHALASGSATSDTTTWIEPDARLPMESPSLQILIGPSIERSLLDIVFGPMPRCFVFEQYASASLDRTTSDLLASLALLKLVGGTQQDGNPQVQSLDGAIRSAIGLLVSAQNDDGGWGWTGRGASHRYSSARAVWALASARAAAYSVPQESFAKAVQYLQDQMTKTADNDLETRAVLLHALTVAGVEDFTLANRLFRSRPSLSTAGSVYLALALAEMKRPEMATQILQSLGGALGGTGSLPARGIGATAQDTVAKRAGTGGQATSGTPNGGQPTPVSGRPGGLAWNASDVEIRALYCLALQKSEADAAKTQELVDWLMAHRTGHRWNPEKATGPAAIALAEWFGKTRGQAEHYQLTVYVNDKRVKVVDVKESAETQTIDVPAELLKQGKQRINFEIAGRGRYSYQCILSGFAPFDRLKSTTPGLTVTRHVNPAPLEFAGRPVPSGFDVLEGSYQAFRNPLTQLPVGKRARVQLYIGRTSELYNRPDEQQEYLVVTEPIPSGAMLVENSVSGGFERYEVTPGAITFYLGSHRNVGVIAYELHGYLPGDYLAGPTLVRDAYRPSSLTVGATKDLTVLPTGVASADQYRLTPRELFELGKLHFEAGRLKESAGHLSDLIANWNLKVEVYKETARMLLEAYLQQGPPHEIVRYFEIIKEKWPDLEVSFEKIVKVASAYHEIGEYERAFLVYRATAESSFGRESAVPGFLEGQGEFVRSVEVMQRLLREYPPENYTAGATYALAQRVYAKAPQAAADTKLREKNIQRVDLVRQAEVMLEDFLTYYADDPAADQASFSLANALLELKTYRRAIQRCQRYAERFPESSFRDSFWYVIGYCHFALGEHEQALAMCRKVAEAKRRDPQTGQMVESNNKWRAIYILGQVYHSLGKAAEAIAEYSNVKDRFADAKEAIEYFTRKALSLPEVTTVEPGKPVEVELAFRNIPTCDLKVYRIDLLKFGLLERNLQNITGINLAGIRPYHEATVKLGDGKDYRDRTHKLALPLKDEGAYLVVGRGEDLHASGLVLVSPLTLDVQTEAPSGRVRTTVKTTTGQYRPDVHVKVIGTRNNDFVSGDTDLRGIFVADGIQGKATIIASADGRYAFHRGQLDLGPPPVPAQVPAAAKPDAAAPKVGKDSMLLEELQMQNSAIQLEQQNRLQHFYKQDKKGVDAKSAF